MALRTVRFTGVVVPSHGDLIQCVLGSSTILQVAQTPVRSVPIFVSHFLSFWFRPYKGCQNKIVDVTRFSLIVLVQVNDQVSVLSNLNLSLPLGAVHVAFFVYGVQPLVAWYVSHQSGPLLRIGFGLIGLRRYFQSESTLSYSALAARTTVLMSSL